MITKPNNLKQGEDEIGASCYEDEEMARGATIDEELSHNNESSSNTSDGRSYNNRMLIIDQLLGSEGFTATTSSSDRNSKM